MPTTLPNMGLVQPTVGGSNGAWASSLNADLLAIDGHRHMPGEGVLIPSAGIGIDGNLSFAGYQATALGGLAFSAVTALTTGACILFRNTADNELYWRTSAGSNVKLTSGTSLNLIFAGGIGGDYAAVSAALNYDDSEKRYTFKQGGGSVWARIAAGELRIHEHSATTSNYVALASPAALASPYTLTFPGALPGSTLLAQVSSAGAITFSNTITNAITCSGLVTASAGVTCAANQHVTVSGTGDVKHGDRVLPLPGCAATGASLSFSTTHGGATTSAATSLFFAIPLRVGDRPKSVTFSRSGDGAVDVTAIDFIVYNSQAASSTSLGSTTLTNVGSQADTTIDLTDTAIGSNEAVFMFFTANAANFVIYNVRVTYDHP